MWRQAGQIALWCLGIGGSLALLNELSPLRWHAVLAAQLAERYWQQKLREVSGQLYAYRERPGAWQAHPEVLFLRYTASGQLREWNTARWPIPKVPPSLRYAGPELVQDDRSLYYCLSYRWIRRCRWSLSPSSWSRRRTWLRMGPTPSLPQ